MRRTYLVVAQGIHQDEGEVVCLGLVNGLKVVRFIELRRVSSRSSELGGDHPNFEVVDFLITPACKHVIEVFRDRNPVVGAVPRDSTFRRLPVTRHVNLGLNRGGGSP